MLSLLFALAFVFIIIDLPQLTVILMIVGGPLSIIGSLIILKVWKRKWNQVERVETIIESDLSAPPQRERFSYHDRLAKTGSPMGYQEDGFSLLGISDPD